MGLRRQNVLYGKLENDINVCMCVTPEFYTHRNCIKMSLLQHYR